MPDNGLIGITSQGEGMHTRTKRIAGLALTALLATGCGGSEERAVQEEGADGGQGGAAAVSNEGEKAKPDPNTSASTLRSTLTGLLEEHQYLAATAVDQRLNADETSFNSAAATLDTNSIAMSNAVTSIYGDQAGSQFLDGWRDHISNYVQYADGRSNPAEAAKADEARAALDRYPEDAGELLSSESDGELDKAELSRMFDMHIDDTVSVIDAQVAQDPKTYDLLKTGSDHLPDLADTMSKGIVQQYPDKFEGDPDAEPSEVRADLTHLLTEHVYLAGTATGKALTGDAAASNAAVQTLDRNSVELSQVVGQGFGNPQAGNEFLTSWRSHIQLFQQYARAAGAKDQAGMDAAKAGLATYREEAGAFFERSSQQVVPKAAIADELEPHVDSVLQVIDAQAENDDKQFENMKAAADHMPPAAGALASAFHAFKTKDEPKEQT